MNKLQLSETDICDQFITPALQQAGWSLQQHILREYTLRPGRVVVRGQSAHRDKASILRADYVLFHKPNLPLAVVEAKDAAHAVGAGMPQAIQYARTVGRALQLRQQWQRLRVPRCHAGRWRAGAHHHA